MVRAFILAVGLTLFCVLQSLTAHAQTPVVNPTTVEFDPSLDNDIVTNYELRVFLRGATSPFTSASLGKPAIASDGKIRASLSTVLIGWPLADGSYEARVAAVSSDGE